MIERLRAWRARKVRCWQPTERFYVRITPNFGLSLPWFDGKRIRIAKHHGMQLIKWIGHRYYVETQILGRSSVRGEEYI